MRFLNKITFINSATIKYAEVSIDGNVHFIGTQGVGKSTLLRSILFFYNADTLKLGISKEKKSFAEYYFPYQNSYLIYEVTTETGAYSIIAFKSQGKVCFRFTDAGYDKKYFIATDGKAFESWDATRAIFDAEKIYYTKKIDRYEEYRDILYGNNDTKKEFRKYALLESKQYQNIPRTIQNVFLNSKLDAEFIKQTIIMSLNEEDIEIDLQSYTHHLKNFETQLNDINIFRQVSVQKQAENVVKFHTAIRHLDREKIQLSQQLAYSIHQVQRLEPKLFDKKEREENNKVSLLQKIEESDKRFQNKILKLKAEVSVLDDKLKTIKEKKEFYEQKNIDDLVERISKRNDLETELTKNKKEKELFSAQYKEVTQKFELMLLNIENSHKELEQNKTTHKLQLKDTFFGFKSDAKEQLDKLLADIKQNQKQSLDQAQQEIEQKQQALQELRIKKEALKHKRFYEEELIEANKLLNDLQFSIKQCSNEVTMLKSKQETLHKQWELESSGLKQNSERETEKLNESIVKLQQQVDAIDSKINNSKDSLYGWLNQHQQGWENNIGKVIGEDILFQNDLAPQKKDGATNSFYGVEINLNEISNKVKTVADYEAEKKQLQSNIELNKKKLNELVDKQTEEQEKLKRKYQPKIKETKESLAEQEYNVEQSHVKLDHAKLNQKDIELKAQSEKQEALLQMDADIDASTEKHFEAKQAKQQIEDSLQKQLKSKEKEYEKRVAIEEEVLNFSIQKTDEEIKKSLQVLQHEKLKVTQQQKAELAGKGADTQQLTNIEKQINKLQTELNFIEKNRDIVAEYNKDKRELLDKVDAFKNKKQLLDQQCENDEQKHEQQKQKQLAEVKTIEENITSISVDLQKAKDDIEGFAKFQLTECYLSIAPSHKEPKEEFKSDKRTKNIIDELNRCYYNGIKRLDELKEAINKFLSNFSSQNIFNFATGLIAKQQYLDFAEQLNEFITDNKIEEFEKRINERFATIINSVGKETTNLMSKGDEIQKVISNINKDFDRKNFVGAIKKIELRLDESANRVVHLLLAIKKYNDENIYDIGGLNLFSSIDSETKNKKAVDLLKQLSKAINEYKKDTISLSDSFELKFRIEENQNDTGWVEKLANVGSEGTDVLVKAMINIMLLNVFKEGASKRFKDFRLHCMMDEIGKLHPNNVKGILQFANDRNILLINGSPTETNAMDYRHIYKLEKDAKSFTKVKRIISNHNQYNAASSNQYQEELIEMQ
jgi:hypothetical protein